MIKEDIALVDELITIIKSRIDSNNATYNKFEFYLILCLEIVRYELYTNSKITDLTAEAITQLFAFQCFEMYYRDYPDIYSKCSDLSYELRNYNERYKNDELSAVGVKDKNWINFFDKSISLLILANKPNNY